MNRVGVEGVGAALGDYAGELLDVLVGQTVACPLSRRCLEIVEIAGGLLELFELDPHEIKYL